MTRDDTRDCVTNDTAENPHASEYWKKPLCLPRIADFARQIPDKSAEYHTHAVDGQPQDWIEKGRGE